MQVLLCCVSTTCFCHQHLPGLHCACRSALVFLRSRCLLPAIYCLYRSLACRLTRHRLNACLPYCTASAPPVLLIPPLNMPDTTCPKYLVPAFYTIKLSFTALYGCLHSCNLLVLYLTWVFLPCLPPYCLPLCTAAPATPTIYDYNTCLDDSGLGTASPFHMGFACHTL